MTTPNNVFGPAWSTGFVLWLAVLWPAVFWPAIFVSVVIASVDRMLWADEPEANAAEAEASQATWDSPTNELAIAASRILEQRCISCHGFDKQESDFRLDTREGLLAGGTRGDVVAKVDRAESLLMRIIRGEEPDLAMPPKQDLTSTEVRTLEKWIEAGAPWPALSEPIQMNERIGNAWEDSNNPIAQKFGGDRLELWSLRPIRRPVVPPVIREDWPLGDIDRFLLADWESRGWSPAPDADSRTIVRRVASDLIGLPPTIEQVTAVENSGSPWAYERLVDELLGSNDYGVHLARFWLDVVRYSDSNGFDWDEFRPEAWRYRDYVVRAFNRDMPFDRFLTEQLAGDELLNGAPKSSDEQDAFIATGYLRAGPHDNAASLFNEEDRSRAEFLADLTETTGSAFLGITFACCRCHDHKTDPLTHSDHYRFRAFFAAVQFADDVSIDLESEQGAIALHNAPIEQGLEEIDAEIKKVPQDAKSERERLEAEKTHLEDKKKSHTYAMLAKDQREDVPFTYVLSQGDHREIREVVEPGFPSVLFPNPPQIERPTNERSTGRRLALAKWMVSHENPWTARVIVNRLWQSNFGIGLVETPNDFGISGSPPSNPALLDWLASELVQSGWSLKHIQRLIVTSRAYRQVARSPKAEPFTALECDRCVSAHVRLRRMTAEQLRDATLAVSGLLQHPCGGPPVWPALPVEILQANPAFLDDNSLKTKGWYPSPPNQQSVRSLYLVQKRTVRIPLLETFDLPENSVSCAKRECSIVAPQALCQLNGTLAQDAANAFAGRCEAAIDSSLKMGQAEKQVALIRSAFLLAFQREPQLPEMEAALQFLNEYTLPEFCRVLLNTNEFAFIE